MKPFDYVNSINTTKKDIMVDDFIVEIRIRNSLQALRSLVYFKAEMNIRSSLQALWFVLFQR